MPFENHFHQHDGTRKWTFIKITILLKLRCGYFYKIKDFKRRTIEALSITQLWQLRIYIFNQHERTRNFNNHHSKYDNSVLFYRGVYSSNFPPTRRGGIFSKAKKCWGRFSKHDRKKEGSRRRLDLPFLSSYYFLPHFFQKKWGRKKDLPHFLSSSYFLPYLLPKKVRKEKRPSSLTLFLLFNSLFFPEQVRKEIRPSSLTLFL